MRVSILFILLLFTNIFAQISYGGSPKFYSRQASINFIEPDRNNLIDREFSPMVFQFGTEYNLDIPFFDEALVTVDDDIYTFVLGVSSEDAYGIGINFGTFFLTDNAELYLYDKERTTFIGALTSLNNKNGGLR